jgi:hypothetical protein
MDELRAIEAVVRTYFDGLHEGDVGKLGSVFHPTADLRSVGADGALAVLTRADWLAAVASRESAAKRGLAREDWIVTIDMAGPATAFAKVKCQIPPRYFTDYLTLGKVDGAWVVVGKTFQTETR